MAATIRPVQEYRFPKPCANPECQHESYGCSRWCLLCMPIPGLPIWQDNELGSRGELRRILATADTVAWYRERRPDYIAAAERRLA